MPRKSKGQRKNNSLFCSKRRRKFPDRKEFDADEKQVLASSDLGSWFSQEQQWPEKFNDTAASVITEGVRQQRVQVRGSWKRARKRYSRITALTNQTVLT
jgi:hypothetical protein